MAPGIVGGAVLSALASRLVGGLIGSFMGSGSGEPTLEAFLRVLSEDFLHRVETVVRAAFTEQNLLEIRTNVTAAATALRTYVSSDGRDASQLDLAASQILLARSRLSAITEQFLAFLTVTAHIRIADPLEKGRVVLNNIHALKASMAALQAVAALDLTILMYKQQLHPGLNREIVARVGEYRSLAERIEMALIIRQTFRTTIKCTTTLGPCYADHISREQGLFYVDGVVRETRTETLLFGSREDYEKSKNAFTYRMAELVNQENARLDEAIRAEINAPGGIAAAKVTWQDVVTHMTP